MKTALSLLLLLGAAYTVHLAVIDRTLPLSPAVRTTLSVGLLLLAAWLTGELFERINLPKICGYLTIGFVLGPEVLALIPKNQVKADSYEDVPPLKFINDLAVALIALLAGGEIKLDWLRQRARRMALLLSVETTFTMTLMVGVVFFGSPWIPFMRDLPALERLIIALLAGVVMISNSPAVIIAMISEYRARGPMTQTMLGFAVCKDLLLIILFATVMSVGRGQLSGTGLSAGFVLAVAVQLLGSIAIGAGLGVAMAWYVHRVRAHLVIFLVGSCLLFAFIGELYFTVAGNRIHLETLLMALTAGLLCQNLWPRASEPMFEQLEHMALPIYCLFFAFAGAKIETRALEALWYVSVALVGVRAFGIWLGMKLGARAAGLRERWAGLIWLGMIPQAGVSLVLVTLISNTFDRMEGVTWGPALASVLIGMIVIHETLGPIGMKHALIRSGEAAEPTGPSQARTASPAGS